MPFNEGKRRFLVSKNFSRLDYIRFFNDSEIRKVLISQLYNNSLLYFGVSRDGDTVARK